MLQEAFLLTSQVTQSRNSRITQMGFINKSPTASFQMEGRGIQWETWRIKRWKQEPKLIFQAAQRTYFPRDAEGPPRR